MSDDHLIEAGDEFEVTVNESAFSQNNYGAYRTVIIEYNKKYNCFSFDQCKEKIIDMVKERFHESNKEAYEDELKKFENSLENLIIKCKEANPPILVRAYINSIAFSEIILIALILGIIWVILILDIVILAIEIFFIKKIKFILWRWKEKKIYKKWAVLIRKETKLHNLEYERYGIFWKFHKKKKVIEFTMK